MKEIDVELLTSWEVGGMHLRIVGRPFAADSFRRLLAQDAIYKEEYENDEELPGGWYLDIRKGLEAIEAEGYAVSEGVKARVLEYRDRLQRMPAVEKRVFSWQLQCPICREPLQAGEWTDEGDVIRATLKCYRDSYCAVLKGTLDREEYEVIDAGFDDEKNKEYQVELFWEKAVLAHGSVGKAKAAIMEQSKVGACLICGIDLADMQAVLDHLQSVHGCD